MKLEYRFCQIKLFLRNRRSIHILGLVPWRNCCSSTVPHDAPLWWVVLWAMAEVWNSLKHAHTACYRETRSLRWFDTLSYVHIKMKYIMKYMHSRKHRSWGDRRCRSPSRNQLRLEEDWLEEDCFSEAHSVPTFGPVRGKRNVICTWITSSSTNFSRSSCRAVFCRAVFTSLLICNTSLRFRVALPLDTRGCKNTCITHVLHPLVISPGNISLSCFQLHTVISSFSSNGDSDMTGLFSKGAFRYCTVSGTAHTCTSRVMYGSKDTMYTCNRVHKCITSPFGLSKHRGRGNFWGRLKGTFCFVYPFTGPSTNTVNNFLCVHDVAAIRLGIIDTGVAMNCFCMSYTCRSYTCSQYTCSQ